MGINIQATREKKRNKEKKGEYIDGYDKFAINTNMIVFAIKITDPGIFFMH